MFRGIRVVDISLPLREGTVRFPGDPPFVREEGASLEGGDGYALSVLRLSAHAGSHLDFPAHLFPGGKGAGDYPPGAFLLPAVVVPWGAGPEVPAEALDRFPPSPGEAILFRTASSEEGVLRGRAPLSRSAFLSPAAARACVGRGAALVGIDGLSVDPLGSPDLPAHRILLGAGIPLLEGVDLAEAPPGRCDLACLPLSLPGCEASPVRAVLLVR